MQQWLSSVFTSDQTITDYPINAQAVDVLYSAALEAKQHEARSQLVALGYRQKAEEYKTEGTFIDMWLLVYVVQHQYKYTIWVG